MRKVDNLQPSCAVVTKTGSLNFLEPSGPVQACNGTALPFFRYLHAYCCVSLGFFNLDSTHVNLHVFLTIRTRWRSLRTFEKTVLLRNSLNTGHNTPPPYVDGDKTHTRTQRMNTFYTRKFSTNYLIYILNFNIW